jgi:hypothetical protein
MDRTSMMRGNGFAWGVLLACALSASACGDPSCPAGSISVGGRCEPAAEDGCREGEVENDAGQCMDHSSISPKDAGRDADVGSDDSSVDETVSRDSGMKDSGEVDSEVIVPVPPLCESVECGDHSTCIVVDDEPVCECDEGYGGDQCAPLCEADDAPACSEHSECEVIEDVAVCVCEHPYLGATCTECATGFAMEDGSCVPDCGTCEPHSVCNETLETPSCECVAGYAKVAGVCQWVGDGVTGGIVNGDLLSSEGWTAHNVSIASGAATFSREGSGNACELGYLAQELTMPMLDDSGPMAVEVDISTSCNDSNSENCPSFLLEIGDSVTRLPVKANATRQTLVACLGAHGYGENVALTLRPSVLRAAGGSGGALPATLSCETTNWPTVEAIRVKPVTASVCPYPTWIANGSFTSPSGWSLSNATIASGALTFMSQGTATATIVVPSAEEVESPALRVQYTNGGTVYVAIDGALRIGAVVAGAGASGAQTVCLPDWSGGAGHVLQLTGSATTVLSDVAIVNEPSCGDGAFDAGFERAVAGAAPSQSWIMTFGASGSPSVDAVANHRGTKGLRMSQAINGVVGLARVPFAEAGSGPAFEVWTRQTSTTLDATAVIPPAEPDNVSLSPTTGWSQHLECLPRAWEGQLVMFGFVVSLTNGPGTLYVDDLGPILHSTCD